MAATSALQPGSSDEVYQLATAGVYRHRAVSSEVLSQTHRSGRSRIAEQPRPQQVFVVVDPSTDKCLRIAGDECWLFAGHQCLSPARAGNAVEEVSGNGVESSPRKNTRRRASTAVSTAAADPHSIKATQPMGRSLPAFKE